MLNVLGVVVLLLTFLTSAHAERRDFRLVNNTRHNITAVYFSHRGNPNWVRTRGGSTAANSYTEIGFDGSGECLEQLRVDWDDDGTSRYSEWRDGMDLCATSVIEITEMSNHNLNAHWR